MITALTTEAYKTRSMSLKKKMLPNVETAGRQFFPPTIAAVLHQNHILRRHEIWDLPSVTSSSTALSSGILSQHSWNNSMLVSRQAATSAQILRVASTSSSLLRAPYGRKASLRSLSAQCRSERSLLSQHSRLFPSKSPSPSLLSLYPPFRSAPSPSLSRPFHSRTVLFEQSSKPEGVKDPPRPEEEASAKSGSNAEGESKGEDSEGGKEEKKEAPPPPPHGDKSPWQVFRETLQAEFKASKEWNESTKQLGGAVQQFTESDAVRRAREMSEQATSRTGEAFKVTGKALGQGAAWTWDSTLVQGLRKGVNATGRGIEKATRPVRETKAFKEISNAVDDGSSSRYGGWVEKEERRKKKELRDLEDLKAGKARVEKFEEDPNAGTNVTVHKDAAWKESWNQFRDQSKLMQSLFSMKSTYNESENPLISTARSITDRFAGFFAENETAMVIKKFREIDPNFQLDPFLRELREWMLPEVLDAYVKGDVETLKIWLSAAQFQVYSALTDQYTKAGLKSDGRILDIRHVDILNARLLDPGEIPVFIVTARTQEVHVYRNAKTGDLAAGMEDRVQLVTYVIGLTRIAEDVNNAETRGWRLIEMQKANRDYL